MWVSSSGRFVTFKQSGTGIIAAYGCDTQALLGRQLLLASAAAAAVAASLCFSLSIVVDSYFSLNSISLSPNRHNHHHPPIFLCGPAG